MIEFWYLFRQNKGAVVGLACVLVLAVIALLAPWLTPHEPMTVFGDALKVPPFWQEGAQARFLLGTDDLGRDLLSRLIYGSRVSLGIGFFVVAFMTFFGVIFGVIAGSFEGWVDSLIMRSMDILMALPSILLSIVVVAVLGPSLVNTVIAVGIVSLPSVVRVVRASVLMEKKKNYVIASKSFGASWFRIYIINILPNCTAPLLIQATFGFSDGILSAAALGFLGLGVQPPIPEWGTMLSDARSYMESASWLVTLPGLCILVVVVAFNLLGDGLRDALDPKVKRT
ncbi:MAG: diguanylate cyclase [Bdellovibrio sp. CG10_big_fil_rev_8_21_14_0_10_47_8]|nr:MAG: diguanylate cyclase [Bdellovibrio sp. CG10_big_fil_rev_8_21_14_0_10_47_8]